MTPLQQLHVSESLTDNFLLSTIAPSHTRSTARIAEVAREFHLAKSPRTVRVALAGCGVVGGGLVRLLHESASSLASRFGVRFVITKVLVRDAARDRKLPIDSHLFTNDLEAFLAHDADVVIEAVGGDEPARTIAVTALRRGRKLITANKELIATHGDSLQTLATENLVGLDFGAAVGGSAPVISTLRDLLGASAPRSIRGILNGTSNFVISEVERGVKFDDAVAAARARGLAESDCSRDLDGRDAEAKLSIVAWIAFGIRPTELRVRTISPLPNLEKLSRFATRLGARLRFIAECTQLEGNCVVAAVEPVLVPESSAFARTTGEENRVEVDLGWTSPLSVSGPGAGGAPTAAALLSDLLRSSAPPNARGNDAEQFFPAIDDRAHSWLIAATTDTQALRSLAANAGLKCRFVTTDGEYAGIIVDNATWDRAHSLLEALRSLNAAPCVARCDLAIGEETQ